MRPNTQAEIDALVKHGVRDIRGAAAFLGTSKRTVQLMLQRREVWSFIDGGRRKIPVAELRRYLGVVAMLDQPKKVMP